MQASPALIDRINGVFQQRLGMEAPSPDTDLFSSGTLDSLEFSHLLLRLEDEFGLKFTFENMDMESFRSTAGLADFIASHAAA